ncbi:MAG TPA: hypothetical protein PKX32_07540, partial [Candidatus Saccharicenans sp.]|nr:hypothetical protein [Candidatus Saccharicenans sp.]
LSPQRGRNNLRLGSRPGYEPLITDLSQSGLFCRQAVDNLISIFFLQGDIHQTKPDFYPEPGENCSDKRREVLDY